MLIKMASEFQMPRKRGNDGM